MRFEERGVLVTGGASGIGLAIADEFLAEGATGAGRRPRRGRARRARRTGSAHRTGSRPIEIDLAEPDGAGPPRRRGRARASAASTCSSTTPA